MSFIIPTGSFLIPGDYIRRNSPDCGASRFGIVLASQTSLRGYRYRILLVDGVDRWVNDDTIADLFEVVNGEG